MRKTIYLIIFGLLFQFACAGRSSKRTTRVVKPKYHHRWFERKKDKRTKRVKVVRMKN